MDVFEMDDVFDRDDQQDNIDADDYDTDLTTPMVIDDSLTPIESTEGRPIGVRANVAILRDAVDVYYDALNRKFGIKPMIRDYTKFSVDSNGKIHLIEYPHVDIINIKTGEPLAFGTVVNRLPHGVGVSNLMDQLGLPQPRPRGPQAAAVFQGALRALRDTAAEVETIPIQDLGGVATEAIDRVRTMETSFAEGGIDDSGGMDGSGGFPLRELRGLDLALQRIRGELENNLARLSELDRNIALERKKLTELGDDETDLRRRKTAQLNDLMIERSARLEVMSTNREELRSQISRVRETIHRVLNEDTTLGERLRTLFREQGITIVSILTAIGMAISTLVLALTGGGSSGMPAPTPTPTPPDKGGLREWAKKKLQDLGRLLARLAGKAAAALPGIIGSVVSWLLNTLGKTATWLAGNLWAMLLAIAGLLLMSAREWLVASTSTKKPKSHKA